MEKAKMNVGEGDPTMSLSQEKRKISLSVTDGLTEDHIKKNRHESSDQKRCPSPGCESVNSEKSRDYPLEFKNSNQGRCSSPSCESMKSDKSRDYPLEFKQSDQGRCPSPSCESMKSDKSRDYPLEFKQSDQGRCPSPSGVSIKSDKSRDYPLEFKQTPRGPSLSCESIISDKSRDYPLEFKHSDQRRCCPSPSCESLKSDKSRDYSLEFKQSYQETAEHFTVPQQNLVPIFKILEESIVAFIKNELKNFQKQQDHKGTCLSREEDADEKRSSKDAFLAIALQFLKRMKHGDVDSSLMNSSVVSQGEVKKQAHLPGNDELSAEHDIQARPERVHQKPLEDFITHQTNLKILEDDILHFAQNELQTFCKILSQDFSESSESQEVEVDPHEDENEKIIIKKAFLKITLDFMRNMKQEELAHTLLNKSVITMCQHTLKSNLKNRFGYVFEGLDKAGNSTLLNRIYTELYITEGTPAEVSCKHEVKLIERAFLRPTKPELTIRREDIFKCSTGRDKPVRTVMTEGVAGIGKTVLTKKFALDWAEGNIYQHIQFIFPLSFRELNMLMREKFSLVELIHLLFPEIKEAGIHIFEEFRVLFIFDGLDECRFDLDLKTKEVLTDVTEPASLDVILTNLMKGKLLPSAQVWITTRPAAAHQIPPELVDLVTEVRGFNDPQKEEYFRKRFTEEEESRRIISHLKSSRSLHIMCHIPVFCWISATVLEDAFKTKTKGELPTSLTEMYVYFLVVLSKVKNVKYDEVAEANPLWTPQTRDMIQSLGKLAFEQLMKGNLFFYESDLMECGIDVSVASVYSGVFTEIFKEERGVFQDKVFCFVHLSIQEFLAALHVYLTFTNTGVNLLSEEKSTNMKSQMSRETLDLFYQSAVDKALKTPKGHLNLFLRFLLGLSLETNQTLLRGLVIDTTAGSGSNQNTIQYIKEKIAEIMCLSKKANLFQCLNELKDYCLVDEIQQTLRSSKLKTENLSPAQLTILVNIMLSSEENLELFDLRKYPVSQNVQLALLPLFIHSTKAVLSYLALTEMSYTLLVSGLQSPCGTLKDLDLSNNDLQDSGMKLLCEGLCDSNCKLETLSLSGCLITKEGCAVLESALKSNPSHLTELDLSYNHPEESGVKLLSAGLKDPNWALQTLKTEPAGAQFLNPGLNKYAYELIMDPSSAHRNLQLSDNNRKVAMGGKKQLHPDDPERSDVLEQLLCKDGLTGRCYWEVEWRGRVSIGVTYKGESDDCGVGMNKQSWTLLCSDDGLSVQHGNKITPIHGDPSNRLGLYLDWPGGIVSFFGVSLGKSTYLHSFTTKFTEPVYPAFGISTESSLSLC